MADILIFVNLSKNLFFENSFSNCRVYIKVFKSLRPVSSNLWSLLKFPLICQNSQSTGLDQIKCERLEKLDFDCVGFFPIRLPTPIWFTNVTLLGNGPRLHDRILIHLISDHYLINMSYQAWLSIFCDTWLHTSCIVLCILFKNILLIVKPQFFPAVQMIVYTVSPSYKIRLF